MEQRRGTYGSMTWKYRVVAGLVGVAFFVLLLWRNGWEL
jgi:hypothetical protein